MIDKDTPIFDNVSLSDIFKKIYANSEDKKDKINSILDSVKDLIGTLADASIMLPMIKEVLEISVKNDEQLVKMSQVIQRILDKNEVNKITGIEDLISDEEKTKLIKESQKEGNILEGKSMDERLNDLNNMVSDAKTFIRENEKKSIAKVDKEKNEEKKS